MSTDVSTIFTTTFAIVGLAGGVVGYFGKSRGDSIIKYQANEIALRDGTIARLEKDNAALLAENNSLKDQNDKLWSRAQGSTHLKTLTKAVETLTQIVNDKLKA